MDVSPELGAEDLQAVGSCSTEGPRVFQWWAPWFGAGQDAWQKQDLILQHEICCFWGMFLSVHAWSLPYRKHLISDHHVQLAP